MGGFDGDSMIPSVEIYDPRLGTWIMGEPMDQSRGYSAAVVVKDSIYVTGGLQSDDTIVDIVSCISLVRKFFLDIDFLSVSLNFLYNPTG